ncbi:PREDICTED: phenolic glucoside malonyltransferase 2-like [Nelumbo nucifera]|nr:PREDICTED: phenolic glucoside malonyltransferase 2-like [Nelumbo nucifera]
MVHYKDGDSVSLTVAQFEGGFHRFSGNQARESKESHSLHPQLSVSGSAIPVLALQITVFPNSGISFGFSFHHSIADARTLTHFINSWASICKLGKPSLSTESLPLYDRTLIKDPKGIEKIFMNQLAIFFRSESGERRLSKVANYSRASNAVRTTFQLSRADVARLKERILAQHKKDKRSQPPRLSTFTVVCAYVWVCLVQSGDERIHFLINVDCRSRLDPSVPWTYFGNCIGNRVVKAERDDLLEHDAIAKAAKLIEEKTKQLEKGIFDGAEFWLSHILSAGADPKFGAAGSNHLGFYEADFGWGRPKKVELVSIDRSGLLFIAENPNDRGGAEISLTLEKHEMDVFSSMFCNGLSAGGNTSKYSRL